MKLLSAAGSTDTVDAGGQALAAVRFQVVDIRDLVGGRGRRLRRVAATSAMTANFMSISPLKPGTMLPTAFAVNSNEQAAMFSIRGLIFIHDTSLLRHEINVLVMNPSPASQAPHGQAAAQTGRRRRQRPDPGAFPPAARDHAARDDRRARPRHHGRALPRGRPAPGRRDLRPQPDVAGRQRRLRPGPGPCRRPARWP